MRQGKIRVSSENILPVIKKWLYSDKDIFLRELVSNACDACFKRDRLIAAGECPARDEKPKIVIRTDKEARLLKVEDNGIGMTEEEVEKYITQVAFSGARDFLEKYKDAGEGGIIGHFGLGFYSAFMVSDTVEIQTLSCREGAVPVRWKSDGDTDYEIGEGGRTVPGTEVILKIAESETEFLEEFRLRELLRKYCEFLPVEIFLNPKEGEENRPVNETEPLWNKAPKDCTKEDCEGFYSRLFADFNPPLFWIHLNVDYPFRLKGILYFPRRSQTPELMPGEIKLYSNRVFVADNVKELVPEYLMLLKGVIDCPDLPLNVSRSFLQNDGEVQKISKHIVKKVSDKLHELFEKERETYENCWEDIAPFVKFGCLKDDSFYDRVKDILLLKTADGKHKTLAEFPKADGKIYYVSDEAVQAQYVKLFRERGLEAAVLTHPLDPHFISYLEFRDRELKFARIDSDSGDALKEGEAGDEAASVAERFKALLGEEKLKFKAEKLGAPLPPAVMLQSEQAARLREMSKLYGAPFTLPDPEETLVLNLDNEAVAACRTLPDEKAQILARYIRDLALLAYKPLSADEMSAFIERGNEILKWAAGV